MQYLIFKNTTYEVDHAVKGTDFIHGYDATGKVVVAFEGVTDFSVFEYDGSYLAPEDCISEPCNDLKYCAGKLQKRDGTAVTPAAIGAAPSGLHRCYGSLKDIGITTFPTTMSVVANAMPENSMIVIDTRSIISGGAQEISDWGNTSNGTAYINKGWNVARVTMAVVYGSGTAVKGRLLVGNWANSTNTVGWCDYGFDGNENYPGCFYRSVDGVTEWINPPAIVGVEYRTTERRNGRVVYTKMIGCGTIPASGRTVTAHNLNSRITRYTGSMSSNLSLPYRDPLGQTATGVGNGTLDLAVSGNNIIIVSNMTDGQSPGTAYVQLWYVKD